MDRDGLDALSFFSFSLHFLIMLLSPDFDPVPGEPFVAINASAITSLCARTRGKAHHFPSPRKYQKARRQEVTGRNESPANTVRPNAALSHNSSRPAPTRTNPSQSFGERVMLCSGAKDQGTRKRVRAQSIRRPPLQPQCRGPAIG